MEPPGAAPVSGTGTSSRQGRIVGPLAVGAVLVGLAAAYVVTSRGPGLVTHDAVAARPVGLVLDVNSASADELAILPGLGAALARRIVAHRDAHGPFHTLDGLLDVPGIGPATLAGIRPFLRPAAAESGP